jgi:dihydroorotate dehydrogenase electron transfer subunit
MARESLPGQFVNVRCTPLSFGDKAFESVADWMAHRRRSTWRRATLLMRPFAVHRAWNEGPECGQVEILFKVVGTGTAALAERKPGDRIELLGPLGKGFDLEWCQKLSTAAVVAGGVGIAPLYPLIEHLRRHDVTTLVIIGAMSEEDMPIELADSRVALSFMATRPELTITAKELERMGCEVGIVTMTGTKGYVGLPTEMLDRFLHWTDSGARGEAGVFTCGPAAMMREIARHSAEHELRCQVLLEERMGCGVGACMACTCKIRSDNGEVLRKRLCVDGPVFNANEVVWDEI